ncbi:DUF4142 domain-containing protein [Caenimonas sp. SL110]|uniref:DUF4142 domain-containing protein n=1 Tax=Caenimonas sp. SL110 TaxID=1450524 RepID=UPI0009E31820|nr:DUF4142 domain-containing protein [Caenimonas sp. SL110]
MKTAVSCLLIGVMLVPLVALSQEGAEQSSPPGTDLSHGAADAPRPVVRVPLFAPSAAASAKRMPVEQRAERGFLRNAATSSRFELEASNLAARKSGDASIRAFAARLNATHRASGQQLQHMLHARGMAMPMFENSQRKVLNRLEKLDGAKFDREFMAQLGTRYQTDEVQMFERAQKVVKDPALAAWIERSLATLKDNLALAEQSTHGDVKLARSASFATAARQTSPAVVPGMPMPPPTQVLGAGRSTSP